LASPEERSMGFMSKSCVQCWLTVVLPRLNDSRAQRILWLLEELKLPYEVEIFYRNKATMFAPPELEKIHPLGKAPIISLTAPGAAEPVILAESGFMIQYLCDHFVGSTTMMPKKWKDGQEGKVGGETAEWMRYQYILHYSEGSFMPYLLLALILFSKLMSSDSLLIFFGPSGPHFFFFFLFYF
jgi:glutathione S-transferase